MSTEEQNRDSYPKLPENVQNEVVSSPARLKHVETNEKNVLPTEEDIVQERTQVEIKAGIEQFNSSDLKKVETDEKQVLPNTEDILREKTIQNAALFDHSSLKHVEPQVKTAIEVIDDQTVVQ